MDQGGCVSLSLSLLKRYRKEIVQKADIAPRLPPPSLLPPTQPEKAQEAHC